MKEAGEAFPPHVTEEETEARRGEGLLSLAAPAPPPHSSQHWS